jgi:hypothetical protein
MRQKRKLTHVQIAAVPPCPAKPSASHLVLTLEMPGNVLQGGPVMVRLQQELLRWQNGDDANFRFPSVSDISALPFPGGSAPGPHIARRPES